MPRRRSTALVCEMMEEHFDIGRKRMDGAGEALKVQKLVCKRVGARFLETRNDKKVGIALDVRSGLLPLNGLRHLPGDDTSGWYIWAGSEPSQDADFFVPLHAGHLDEVCPDVVKFLGLAPGWRFLKAGDYEDVWYDESIAKIVG